jgi:hypothetical protein
VLLQLFQEDVPSIPISSSAPAAAAPPQQQQSSYTNFASPENTIDEPVWDTIRRDVVTIGRNLKAVLVPVHGEFSGREAALRNWDLWGPLVSGKRGCAGRAFLRRRLDRRPRRAPVDARAVGRSS